MYTVLYTVHCTAWFGVADLHYAHFYFSLYPEEESEDNIEHDEEKEEPRIFEDSQLAYLVDPVLDHEDINRDGYIDYPEFIAAAKKNKSKQK